MSLFPSHNSVWLVCGGRAFGPAAAVAAGLSSLVPSAGLPSLLVHGGASGADAAAGLWAARHRVPVRVFPAVWHVHGHRAGPIRNVAMLQASSPSLVVAFPGGRGTSHMVRIARAAGVSVVCLSR